MVRYSFVALSLVLALGCGDDDPTPSTDAGGDSSLDAAQLDASADSTLDASTETCTYVDLEYPVGEEFCATDRCNACYCEEGTKNLICTNQACVDRDDNFDPDLAAGACRSIQVGLWHLTSQDVDPVNLGIFSDGRFRWELNGCDARSGASGTWAFIEFNATQSKMELRPESGTPNITWPDLKEVRETIIVSTVPERPGEALVVQLNDAQTQVWERGGQCPICGELGPTGVQPCDSPLLPE